MSRDLATIIGLLLALMPACGRHALPTSDGVADATAEDAPTSVSARVDAASPDVAPPDAAAPGPDTAASGPDATIDGADASGEPLFERYRRFRREEEDQFEARWIDCFGAAPESLPATTEAHFSL